MAKSANMFGFFLDELHKSGVTSPSSSSLSSADFSAALDFALQPRVSQEASAGTPRPSDVVGTILREVARAEPETSTLVSLANGTGLGIDTLLAALPRAIEQQLLEIVSPAGVPAEYSRTEYAKKLKM